MAAPTTTRRILRCWWTLSAAALLATGAAIAGEDSPAARRDREQLQRMRGAMKELTAQRDALQTEKASWDNERQRLALEAARSKGVERTAAALRKQIQEQESQALQQARELAGLRASLAQAEQQAQVRESALREQLQAARQESGERAAAVRATAQLLERSTSQLARAERSNGQLHAAGLQAIANLRAEWQAQETPLLDPLGLATVRHENVLVSMREALDKARLASEP